MRNPFSKQEPARPYAEEVYALATRLGKPVEWLVNALETDLIGPDYERAARLLRADAPGAPR